MSKELENFLSVRFEPEDLIEIRPIVDLKISPDDKTKVEGFNFQDAKNTKFLTTKQVIEHEEFLHKLNIDAKPRHIFYGAHPRIKAVNKNTPENEKGADNVKLCRGFFTDVDNAPDATLADMEKRIQEAGLPLATQLLNSGHGFHLYWELAGTVEPKDWLAPQQILVNIMHGCQASKNLDRLLRLPTFNNCKYQSESPNFPVSKVEKFNEKAIYAPAEFIKQLYSLEPKQEQSRTQSSQTGVKEYPYNFQPVDIYKLLDLYGVPYDTEDVKGNNQPLFCTKPKTHTGGEDKHPSFNLCLDGVKKGGCFCQTCNTPEKNSGCLVDVILYHKHKGKFPGQDYAKGKHDTPAHRRRVVAEIDKLFPGFINPDFGKLRSPIEYLRLKFDNMEETKEDEWLADCPLCKKHTLNFREHKTKTKIVVPMNCSTCDKDKSADEKVDIHLKILLSVGLAPNDLEANEKKQTAYAFRYDEPDLDADLPVSSMQGVFNVDNIAAEKPLCFEGRISALKDSAYAVPLVATFYCKNYKSSVCLKCGVFNKSEDSNSLVPLPVSLQLDITNQEILDLIGRSPKFENISKQILRSINVFNCKNTNIFTKKNMDIYDTWVVPADEHKNFEKMTFVASSKPLKIHSVYKFYGKLIKHPKTSETIFAAYKVEELKDRIDSEDITEEMIAEAAKNFKPKTDDLQGLEAALVENINDFSRGVTKVFKSFDLHLGKFLACFCPLCKFDYGGSPKWAIIDSAIIGDSGMAKTQLTDRMIETLKYGQNLHLEDPTIPGLLGGRNKKENGQLYQENGKFCIHDKDWIVGEEFAINSETQKKIMRGIRTARSSFEFIDAKMGGRKKAVPARCSKTFERNPHRYPKIENYPYGIIALEELAKDTADVRRFDFVLILSEKETSKWELDLEKYTKYEQKFSNESRQVVLIMAKRLKKEDIIFEKNYLKVSRELGWNLANTFSDKIPLCSIGYIAEKITRLAITFACLAFNYIEDAESGRKLLVRNYHIEYAYNWLKGIYSTPACAFKQYSERIKETQNLIEEEEVKDFVRRSRRPKEFISVLLETPPLTERQITQMIESNDVNINIANTLSRKILNMLILNRALTMDRYSKYRCSTGFINALHELQEENLPNENPLDESCRSEFG